MHLQEGLPAPPYGEAVMLGLKLLKDGPSLGLGVLGLTSSHN